MKISSKLIITIIIFVSTPAIGLKAQVSQDSMDTHIQNQTLAKQLLKKSHDQKVAAIVLGIGGGVLLLTGAGLAAASFKGFLNPNVRHNDYGTAPDILCIGGGALIVTAIPFSLSSHANKKKAKLYMSRENVLMVPGLINTRQFTTIGVQISL